jgi:hypothetical protein
MRNHCDDEASHRAMIARLGVFDVLSTLAT